MTLLAFLVLLGVLITVHELGHFIVAKLSGVKVLVFSIGFGPRLFGFTKGETEYRVSMLPLGGYVRMYGDDITSDVPPEERHRAFLEKPVPIKMAIAFAGPAANLLLPLALFFALSVGEERVVEPVVGTVVEASAAAAAGLVPGDRILAVDDVTVDTFSDLATAISDRPDKVTSLTVKRGEETLKLSATPTPKPSPDPTSTAPVGRLGFMASRPLPMMMAAAESPAAKAGLRFGDRVRAVNGVEVKDTPETWAAIDAVDVAMPLVLGIERTLTDAELEKAAKQKAAAAEASAKADTIDEAAKAVDDSATAKADKAGKADKADTPEKAVVVGTPIDGSPNKLALTITIPGMPAAAPPTTIVDEIDVPEGAPGIDGDIDASVVDSVVEPVAAVDTAVAEIAPEAPEAPEAPVDASDEAGEDASGEEGTGSAGVKALRFAVLRAEVSDIIAQRRDASASVASAAATTQRTRRGLASVEGAVSGVEPESPAAARRLQAQGHRVVAVDGVPLHFASDLQTALAADVDGIHVLGLVDGKGAPLTFTMRLQPSGRRELGGQKIMGVVLTSSLGDAAIRSRDVSVAQAMGRSVTATGVTIAAVVSGYVMLLTGQVGLDQLGGPVMLASIAGEAARSGIETFVGTMALLSVNLALLNLLPVPVLDGGHIMLFTIEGIRRRRLSVTARIRATKVGLFFVGALMVVALFNDLSSLFR